MEWQDNPIYFRPDNSYVVTVNGNPYHVPYGVEEFEDFYNQIAAHVAKNDVQVQIEKELVDEQDSN